MKTQDEIRKMKAVVGYILQQCGGSLDYVKLYKLLYFAQRLHLVRYGRGIVNDTFYARDMGPIPGFVYRGMKYNENKGSGDVNMDLFAGAFRIDARKRVHRLENPDMEEFSRSDLECIDEIIKEYGKCTASRLSDLSHQDAAWQDADMRRHTDPENNKMTRIEIAKAGGASDDMIAYIRHNLELDLLLSK